MSSGGRPEFGLPDPNLMPVASLWFLLSLFFRDSSHFFTPWSSFRPTFQAS